MFVLRRTLTGVKLPFTAGIKKGLLFYENKRHVSIILHVGQWFGFIVYNCFVQATSVLCVRLERAACALKTGIAQWIPAL